MWFQAEHAFGRRIAFNKLVSSTLEIYPSSLYGQYIILVDLFFPMKVFYFREYG